MKDSRDLKKLFLLCSIIGTMVLTASSDLENYLSDEKNMIFDFQEQKNQLETDKLHDSWISPILLSYQKSWTTQPLSGTQSSTAFSIGIDQPIFKSGGIYYAIKYSRVLADANRAEIKSQKRQLIGKAVELLFNIKKAKLQYQKLNLLVRNDNIDIKRKQDSYNAGLLDSSFLDQAILKRNQDESQLLDIELTILTLKNTFKTLSRKNPDKLRTPRLKYISLKHYKNNNSNLTIKKLRSIEKKYASKMTWSRYLPTVSVNARYTNTDQNILGMDDDFSTYGFKITMPLSINTFKDIESSHVSYMQSAIELQDSKRTAKLEYDIARKSLYIIDKRIALAKKDEQLYRSLYKRTKDLVKAGEKIDKDVDVMLNALKIKKIDRRIFGIDKQLQLLKLYTRMNS